MTDRHGDRLLLLVQEGVQHVLGMKVEPNEEPGSHVTVTPDTYLFESTPDRPGLGLDSLDVVEVGVYVEDKIGSEVPEDAFSDVATVRDVADRIAQILLTRGD